MPIRKRFPAVVFWMAALFSATESAPLRADVVRGQIEGKRIGHDTAMEDFSVSFGPPHAGGDPPMIESLASRAPTSRCCW